MSKIIKLTPEVLEQARDEFMEALSGMKLSDGKITYTKKLGEVDRKATLIFTEKAYIKMLSLVQSFDKEVAWHGVAKRGDDPEKDEYIIENILVYPQEVTGATVTTDQEKYQTWLYSLEDEEFNNIRFQGHSHVNMGTTPSSVDTNLYEGILEQLEDDMFYIFLIWNKKNDRTIKIYDLKKNILFETSDVEVLVYDGECGLLDFLDDAKNQVKTSTQTWKGKTEKDKNKKSESKTEISKTYSGEKKHRSSQDSMSEFYNRYYGGRRGGY